MDSPVPDIHTAYHEAGHAVMALALGRNVQRVTIEPDPKRLGACEIKKGSFRPSPDALETSVLIFYGGLVAEGRYRGQYCWVGAGQDLRDIRELCSLRASGEKAIERLERRLLSKAEHILDEPGHWLAIERIAADLMKTPTISGRAARAQFDRAIREAEANR